MPEERRLRSARDLFARVSAGRPVVQGAAADGPVLTVVTVARAADGGALAGVMRPAELLRALAPRASDPAELALADRNGRYLAQTNPDAFPNDRRDVLQPFSMGPRNCIGKQLAYAEGRLILGRFLLKFEMRLGPKAEGWMDQKGYVTWMRPPLEMFIKLRER